MKKTILSIVLIFLLFSLILSRKPKKKKKTTDKKNPKEVKPEGTSPELYCDACEAIVDEMIKKLMGKNKEYDVIFELDNICNQDNFYTYRKINV